MTPHRLQQLWKLTMLLACAVSLRIWDLFLLKRFLDAPARVAFWFVALATIGAAARSLARRIAPDRRTAWQRRVAGVDTAGIVLVLFCLAMLLGAHWGYQRAVSDGREYFVQVRSLVIDHDLDFANENATFGVRGAAPIYPFGAPLLWTPFFVAAHGWLGVLNGFGADLARDGYFNPYQRAVGWGTFLIGCLGLAALAQMGARRYGPNIGVAAVILTCAGSFLAWYFVLDLSMPHAISMASVALFVWYWDRTQQHRSRRQWAMLGALGGLMTMVRWQNVTYGVLAVADLIAALRAPRGDRRRAALDVLAGAATALAAFSPQMLFWRITRGGWLAFPSAEHHVRWTAMRDVLFTPDHGLFTWSPLLLFAAIGFAAFVQRERRFGSLLLVAFAGQLWILGAVESPGYGFGARRLANAAVLFVLGMAALIELIRRRPLLVPALVAAVLIVGNGLFMGEVHARRLPAGILSSQTIASHLLGRYGSPAALPASLWFAWRYGTDLGHYERLGTQRFANFRLDVGADGDDRFLARGFAQPEQGPTGAYRWSLGPESSLLVRLRLPGPYRLVLRAAPLLTPDRRPQQVSVWVNGHEAGRISLHPGMRRYSLPIDATRAGVNQLVLRYRWTASPRALGLSDDDRDLAVQYDRIELLLGPESTPGR